MNGTRARSADLPPAWRSIAQIQSLVASGSSSVAEIAQGARNWIEKLNPAYRAFSHVTRTLEAQAARLDTLAASSRGPLHGVTCSFKGNIAVAGEPFTEGSPLFARRVAATDAEIVHRTRAKGGLLLGCTSLSELAMYAVENAFEPMAVNPWNAARTAGGSSTGAGVASSLRLASINIGTDSGGSVRNPACHSGVVGFVPSPGALPLKGVPSYAGPLDRLGIIAASVADVRTAFEALADVTLDTEAPRGHLLVPWALIDDMCDDETLALFRASITQLERCGFSFTSWSAPLWREAERASAIISLFETDRSLSSLGLAPSGAAFRRRRQAAAALTSDDVSRAWAAAELFRSHLSEALDRSGADAIVTPTWPFAAPEHHTETISIRGRPVEVDPHRNIFVRVANATGACALTLPVGLYGDAGVPAGLHFMADDLRQSKLLRLAEIAESHLPGVGLPPALRALCLDDRSRA